MIQSLSNQNQYPIIHFLIGVPGSGKSTFAKLLSQQGNYTVVSTDDVRNKIYGNATIQGEWQQIEATAIKRICDSLQAGIDVIYDATNFKRALRLSFLQKVNREVSAIWIAWYLNTPIETSIAWNQKRDRQVPEEVIYTMHDILQQFPPVNAEGFTIVEKINVSSPKYTIPQLENVNKKIPRSIVNSRNRYANIVTHQYSDFLDFERLLHLISLIIKYPGIGNLQNLNSKLLKEILEYEPDFRNETEEITAIIAKECGKVYACEAAITNDLDYLKQIGIIASPQTDIAFTQLATSELQNQNINFHSYSEETVFKRLMNTIRFIVNNPYLNNTEGGNLLTLAKALYEEKIICNAESESATIRKDIEKILKPYQILPSFPMRQGYFAGTGILQKQELIELFEILQSQAFNLDDPFAIDLYNSFKQRMLQSKFIDSEQNIYPIRSISNNSIVDENYLHETSLLKKIPFIQEAILSGRLIEFSRFNTSAKYRGDAHSFIQVYPLQIVFHNLAWYLGYECVSGEEEGGLLRFERLDRLFLGREQSQTRSLKEQKSSLNSLHKLLQGSAGIYLGNSVIEQRKFLSSNKITRDKASVTIELWFNDRIYSFIVEGTKRFDKIKMSRPKFKTKINLPKSIFFWDEGTKDSKFTNRFQVTFAQWSLQDFDLWRWIVGFGGNVKVVQPPELVDKIRDMAQNIIDNYPHI